MNERLICLAIPIQAVASGAGKAHAYVLPDCLLVGADAVCDATTGSPTGATLDVQDDETDVTGFAGIDVGVTAGAGATVLTTHLGGSVAVPAEIAAGSVIDIDVNLTGGTSPTFTGSIRLWLLVGSSVA